MLNKKSVYPTLLLCTLLFLLACQSEEKMALSETGKRTVSDSISFVQLLHKHLNAVSNKDLATLSTTFSPKGDMQLILPQSEITSTSKEFLDMHEEWFADTPWTFTPTILRTDIGQDYGSAIVETMYREPERNGKPYFNRMIVTYLLRKEGGQWFVIQDHASSIEKTE